MILEKEATSRSTCWIPLITLTLFAGLRSYRVGTDTAAYTSKFRGDFYVDNYIINKDVEYGYQLFEYALLNFSHNYFWLLFITSLIVVSCYLTIIKKLSKNYIYSVFLFVTFGTYTFFFNGLRQGMAMAIFSLATPYLLEKKLLPFLGITFLASTFHVSALFMIPFYFILHINTKDSYKYILTLTLTLLSSKALISYLAQDNPRYQGYDDTVENPGGLFTLAFYIVLTIVLNLIKKFYHIKDKTFSILLAYYSIGIFFMIPIAMIGTNPSGPQRLLKYFTWVLVILIPVALRKINDTNIYIITTVLAVVYFILTTSKFSNLTPYYLNPIFKVI